MKYDNEKRCKELRLIPIKEFTFGGNFNSKYKFVVNFNYDYGIKIITHNKRIYDVISLKRKEPLILEYNDYKQWYSLYSNGVCYYVSINQLHNYINKLIKKGEIINDN